MYAVAACRQLKAQPYISMPDCFTSFCSGKITNLLLLSLITLCILFELWPISGNVSGGGTIQVLALLRWALSVCNYHPIVLNQCRRDYRWRCCSRCLCRCCALHRCGAWIIPCNVPHLMEFVPFLSIHPLRAVMLFLIHCINTQTHYLYHGTSGTSESALNSASCSFSIS